jgi:hypothetical protein
MTPRSRAGPTEGLTDPASVNVLHIHEYEDSHGSPYGESGLIVLWDGAEYNSDECWLSCHADAVCDLRSWE